MRTLEHHHWPRRGVREGNTSCLQKERALVANTDASPRKVRTLEYLLDLATTRFLLALARESGWLLITWESCGEMSCFLAEVPGAEEGTRTKKDSWRIKGLSWDGPSAQSRKKGAGNKGSTE